MDIKFGELASTSSRKFGLDVLRAVAVWLVLICHFLSYYWGIVGRWAYPPGVLGVELFFVLSGYLIGGILLRAVQESKNRLCGALLVDFWWRRWMRTLPNYLLFLVVFNYVTPDPSWSVLRYLTFTQGLDAPPSFYGVSWSLAVEEWFYLLFPLLVFVGSQTLPRTRHAFFAATIIMLAVPFLARSIYGPGHPWDTGLRKVLPLRLDSIMIGVAVAVIEAYRPSLFRMISSAKVFWSAQSLMLVLFVAFNFRFASQVPDFYSTKLDTFWFYGFDGTCALMLPFLSSIPACSGFPKRLIMASSLWSYSIYLSHMAIMVLLTRLAGNKFPVFAMALTALGSVFLCSWMLYTWFELPVLKLRDKWRCTLRVPSV